MPDKSKQNQMKKKLHIRKNTRGVRKGEYLRTKMTEKVFQIKEIIDATLDKKH